MYRNMKTRFDEKKTTQAAAHLLKKRSRKMSYMKLIKLLYLSDRNALLDWGRPITFDHYVSMDNGPVLSRTYEIINEGIHPGEQSFWQDHISPRENYEVSLEKDPGLNELSDAEIKVLDQVFQEYGNRDRWDIVDNVMHQLPEWKSPNGSTIPIEIRDILKAGGKTDIEISEIENELENLSLIQRLSPDE